MRFMQFGGLVLVVYPGVAYLRSFGAGCCGNGIPGGLEFAFLVFVQVLVAALIVSLGTMLYQELWPVAALAARQPADPDNLGDIAEQGAGYGVPPEPVAMQFSEASAVRS